jgi:hypothetical protein
MMRRTDFYLAIFSFAVLFYFYYMHPQKSHHVQMLNSRMKQRNLAATAANPSSFNKSLDAFDAFVM